MIVVSDTSPICYLILIGQIALLAQLYGQVIIPETVRQELLDERSPIPVREWITAPPDWLVVRSLTVPISEELDGLDPGEQEAIQIAEEIEASLIVLDDRAGRRVAIARGLRVTGLVGVLEVAAEEGLVDLPEVFERLRQTSFRISERILRQILDRFS